MRRQRPRGTITREAILGAALAIVDSARVDGLTIRAVARQVGAPPMSLYSHFANKDELLDLMYGEIVRRLYPDQGYASWQEELFELCQHIRSVLMEHPHWTALLSRPAVPVNVPVRERILALMVRDGLTPEDSFAALSGAALSSTGLVLSELALRNPAGTSSIELRYERIREWSKNAEGSPMTRAAVSQKPKFNLDAFFAFTIRALIRGFEMNRRAPSPS